MNHSPPLKRLRMGIPGMDDLQECIEKIHREFTDNQRMTLPVIPCLFEQDILEGKKTPMGLACPCSKCSPQS